MKSENPTGFSRVSMSAVINDTSRSIFMEETKPKSKMGRPTKFKPAYCQELIDYMAQGYSLVAFAGHIGVSEHTIGQWVKVRPDFNLSYQEARSRCQSFWEKLGMKGINGEIERFNAATYIFNMKNRFKWTDRQDITTDSLPITFVITDGN